MLGHGTAVTTANSVNRSPPLGCTTSGGDEDVTLGFSEEE